MTRVQLIAIFVLIPLTLLGASRNAAGASDPDPIAPLAALAGQDDWPMAAANPQRTSHNSVEVRGNLSVDWYRVIDPFVDSKVQVIASGGKIFLSTSKGLYAFDAASGSQLWVYGTQLPLGNAPTVATVDGKSIAFAPGLDHRVHAIDAATGTPVSGYTPYVAGAGFEANPVVIDTTVYAPNRDGNVYALDAVTGAKKWQYATGGPVRFSPAYNDSVLFVVSDDSFAYALNTSDGSLNWKSARLPGAGFMTYWPVVWTDTYASSATYGQTFILITGSKKASTYNWWADNTAYHQENDEIASCAPAADPGYLWNGSSTILDCSPMLSYFNDTRPDRRNLLILNAATGAEQRPYAPVNWSGASHGGNKFPPVVGADGVLYTHIGYNQGGNGGCSGWLSGWKFGTRYIKQLWNDAGACDEPPAFTSGGNLLYWGEGVNHESWGTLDTAGAVGSNYYTWQNPNHVPGADTKYFYDTSGLILNSIFGSGDNGVYSYYDGVGNQSPIPYAGRLYLVNSNILFALKPSGGANTHLPTAAAPSSVNSPAVSLTPDDVRRKLESEVQKIVSAGHLRPGQYTFGYATRHFGTNYIYNTNHEQHEVVAGDRMADYFHTPGETLATLASALPYLSPSLQTQVRSYLRNEQANFPVQTYAHIGWREGARREAYDDTPEIAAAISSGSVVAADKLTQIPYLSCCAVWVNIGVFPPDAFYGAWKYADAVLTQAEAKQLFDAMKPKLQVASATDMSDANFQLWPYILHRYINGYRGYLELEKLAGYTADISQSSKYGEYQRLLNLRISTFSKESPFSALTYSEYHHNFIFNVARNFMFLSPELGDALNASRKAAVEEAMREYEMLEPYWFIPKYERTYEEGVGHSLYDRWALFQAKAYVLREPFEELVKYLDEPAFERGDLYYIQNLVATLRAPVGGRSPTFGDVPLSHPYNAEIELLYQAGYTAGCSTNPLLYCPEATMNRAESSVFVERGIHTASYDPPAPTSQVFGDLPLDSWAAKWVNGLWADQYTSGCGTNPLVFCPWQGHTRAEGCVFYLRMMNGATYEPPQPATQTFVDVPLNTWYAKWVQAGYDAGLLTPCQTTPTLRFCPDDPLTRALAAHMMVRAKGLLIP